MQALAAAAPKQPPTPSSQTPGTTADHAGASSPRHDIYAKIHKALRLCMSQTLAGVGSLDARDDAEVARVVAEVCTMVTLARGHLHNEETFIHPLLEERHPGSTAAAAAGHEEHHHAFDRIEAGIAALLAAPRGPARDASAFALYRTLALFVADNFVHMDAEEATHNPVLWSSCTDAEIEDVERRIVASLPPDEAREVIRWMAPALDPQARSALLAGMRQRVPPPVFEGVLAMVRPRLSPRDVQKLDAALAA